MLRVLVRRLLLAVPTLAGVLVVVFLLLYVAPGDPVMAMVGERADPQTIARLRAELRLDDPLAVQFAHYAGGVLHGDLGRSYITGRPILSDLLERFPKTLQLAGAAMLLAAVCGITLGVLAARRPGGWTDRLSLAVAYLGISFPVYWIGLLLILVFAVMLRWLPPSGYGRPAHLVLPALALGMRSIAFLARVTRSAMLEALGSDYARTARAKGVAERIVVVRHQSASPSSNITSAASIGFCWKRCFRTWARSSPASSARPLAASSRLSSGLSDGLIVRAAAVW